MNLERPHRLDELFIEHPDLKLWFQNDATVYAWFQQYLHNNCTLQEAFIGVVIHLAREKKSYFDQVIDLKMRYGDGPAKKSPLS